MMVSVLIPHRPDGGERDNLYKFVVDWWSSTFPDWDVVIGRHDGGKFNRGWALNEAARRASSDSVVFVVADGDIIPDPDTVRSAVSMALSTGKKVATFTHRADLSQLGTEAVMRGDTAHSRSHFVGRSTTNVSSCFAISRESYEKVGGFDERFAGWGGEDNAFHATCDALVGAAVAVPRGSMKSCMHLWHEPYDGRKSTAYGGNKLLARRYVKAAANFKAGRTEDLMQIISEDRVIPSEDRVVESTVVALHTYGVIEHDKLMSLLDTITAITSTIRTPKPERYVLYLDSRSGSKGREIGALLEERLGPRWEFASSRSGSMTNLIVGSGQSYALIFHDNDEIHPIASAEMDVYPHYATRADLMEQLKWP